MGVTSDRNDPKLNYIDGDGMQETYLVLSEEERAKGFVRPVRQTYQHLACSSQTTMGLAISETYARDPKFYGGTYCTGCRNHFPVTEFVWVVKNRPTKEKVGS